MREDQVRLLVVDDDADIRTLLADYLRRHGFEVAAVGDGAGLMAEMEAEVPDMVVLDVMLPGEDGLSLCRRLRERWPVPVIFLTALDSVTDRVVGLEIGADDYMVKPFEPRELLARIRTVLRRMPVGCTEDEGKERQGEADKVSQGQSGLSSSRAGRDSRGFDGWRLDVLSRELRDPSGVLVNLSDAQFRLLMVFLEQPFQILSRDALLTILHGREAEPYDRSVDIQVSRLRTRLRDNIDQRLIRTVRGGGYMWSVDVQREAKA